MKINYFSWIKLKKPSWIELTLTLTLVILLFSCILISTELSYPFTKSKMNKNGFAVIGDIPLVNGIAPLDLTYLDSETTLKDKELAEEAIPPILFKDSNISNDMLEQYAIFYRIINRGIQEEDTIPTIIKKVKSKTNIDFTSDFIQTIVNKNNYTFLLDQCSTALENLSIIPIISSSFYYSAPFNTETIFRLTEDKMGNEYQDISLSSILTEKQAIKLELDLLRAIVSQVDFNLAAIIIEKFVVPNVDYNKTLTEQMKKNAQEAVEPTYLTIKKGDLVFEHDNPITDKQYKDIIALSKVSTRFHWQKIIFAFIYLILVMLFFKLFFQPPFISKVLQIKEIGVLYILLLFGVFYSMLASQLVPEDVVHIARLFPIVMIVHAASNLLSLKGGFYLGLIFVMFQPMFTFFVPSLDISLLEFSFALVILGILPSAVAAWLVRHLDNVFDFFIQGIWIFIGSMALALIFQLTIIPYEIASLKIFLYNVLNGLFCILLSPGLILLLEKLFNLTTDHRLVELGSSALPIFKQMMLRAHGTYNHCMQVSAMADAACAEINARGILARIGGLYHDIGKIEMPFYFTENQNGENKHDDIKPQLSASVITSHVKKGVEKGIQLNLPKEVLDIIQQHHGTSAIRYFLNAAQKNTGSNSTITEADYRYDGPVPQSKEAAVVMLADCVEAASHSLKVVNAVELERMIWRIFTEKLEDHQLAGSHLTFNDLETIKQSFVLFLLGLGHERIEYPEMEKKK